MYTKLTKIDELTLGDHYFLEPGDECYFLGEYTANKNHAYSTTNQLIHNLKKSVGKKGKPEYFYKTKAIQDIARILHRIIPDNACSNCTFVPIPPSKIETDPFYDDRLMEILGLLNGHKKGQLDFRKLIKQSISVQASHQSQRRMKPDELYRIYSIDQALTNNLKDNIIIFDDVITAGCHFKAIKRILQEAFPGKKILGIFIARTERSSSILDAFDNLEDF